MPPRVLWGLCWGDLRAAERRAWPALQRPPPAPLDPSPAAWSSEGTMHGANDCKAEKLSGNECEAEKLNANEYDPEKLSGNKFEA